MEDRIIQTPYGVMAGIAATTSYPNGQLESVVMDERNVILTHAGDLIPFYGEGDPQGRRKRKSSVSFHKNGMIKSVSLAEQQDILTPLGEFPAELVTFYDTGELKRFFVLDGQLSGFWSETEERALNIPLSFEFDFSAFSAMLTGICFYKDGNIRSMTLFPGEVIRVNAGKYGTIRVRTGFSLYPDGVLESIEPAVPVAVETSIGSFSAYDSSAIGVNADSNSLGFDKEGRVTRLTTSFNKVLISPADAPMCTLSPLEVQSQMDPDETELLPLRIAFDYEHDKVIFTDNTEHAFSISGSVFKVLPGAFDNGCSPDKCASCSLCEH